MQIVLSILLELFFVAALIIFIYRLKPRFGLIPLYILLGSNQYFQTILSTSFRIHFFNELTISPGAIILFSSSLFAVLLIYIKEGAKVTQQLICGIILSNISFTILAWMTNMQENQMVDIIQSTSLSVHFFNVNARVFIVGTFTLLLDAFMIVILYELLYSKISWLNLYTRLVFTMLFVLGMDSVLFATGSYWGTEIWGSFIISQLIGKSVAAIFFGSFLFIYLRFFDKDITSRGQVNIRGNEDIFSILTYQSKYEKQKVDLKNQINARKMAEDAIIESEEKYRTLAESIPDYIMRYDQNGRHTYMNQAALDISGKTAEEVIGKTHLEAGFDKEQSAFWEEKIKYVFETGKPFQEQFSWESSQGTVYLDWRLSPEVDDHGKVKSVLGVSRDITDLKLTEKKLVDSEKHLRMIMDTEPECVKVLSINGNVLDMNKAGLAMIEADNLDMIKGKSVFQIIDENYRESFTDLIRKIFQGKSDIMEFTIIGLKGTMRWMEINAVPMKNDSGEIISLLGVTRDITERKKAEEENQFLMLRYQQTINSMLDGYILADDKGNIIEVNPSYCKMIGYSKEELLLKNINEIEASLSQEEIDRRIKEMLEKNSIQFETKHRGKDNVILDFEVSISIMIFEGRPLVAAFLRDITERKKSVERIKTYNDQLRMLNKHLQTIREEERKRIAREIHDELGQQLTAIKMDVVWIDKREPALISQEGDAKLVKSKLKNIIQLLDGSNQSIRKILTELRPDILDHYGLLDAIGWLNNQFINNTGIQLKFKTANINSNLPEDISICIFRVYQESLTNITRYSDAGKVLTSLFKEDDVITLTIEDDGKGFDTEILQNENRFGILGMKERVLSLDGKFNITSSPGNGVKISVQLPCKS